MSKILIIKLGAQGDVIRTTPLLRVLGGEITWVTSPAALPLLQNAARIDELVLFDDFARNPRCDFDLVINLEDDPQSAALASKAGSRLTVGPYLKDGAMTYNPVASEWFDMGLCSRFGRSRADELKMQNRRTYQDMVFSALGLTFRGEEPVFQVRCSNAEVPALVGIEDRAGNVWPSKRWSHYRELASRLESQGYTTRFFQQRDSVLEYVDDIQQCEYVICGDTLAMHIALALGKKVVSLFTCTSPTEIYGYGRLAKVVSPLLDQYFYQRAYAAEPGDAISVADVEDGFQTVAGMRLAAASGANGAWSGYPSASAEPQAN